MGKIAILPPALASQIAAGEVVERPASAVKELVENAIDAGATRCDVEIQGGGIQCLRVVDDGSGMTAEDAELSLQRHATSKISRLEQLPDVATLGFRGEALPSIASVSRFTLRTRPAAVDAGVELSTEAGADVVTRPVGMPPGTHVEVRDLFFNVPARRKFLRSSGTESGHIAEVLENAALAEPGMTFTLTRDGRKSREWLRTKNRADRVNSIFSGEAVVRCTGERGPLVVEAYLTHPDRARVGAGGLRLLVNNRPVRDRAVLLTVAQAYGSALERGRYPRGVVYLELPLRLVDINAHPQKTEVRFADPRAVCDAVYEVLSKELAQAFSLPAAKRSQWNQRDARAPIRPYPQAGDLANESLAAAALTAASPVAAPRAAVRTAPLLGEKDVVLAITPRPAAPHASQENSWRRLRFLAQVKQTYLICEGPDGLYVLDQHAASERINFDKLRRQYQARNVPSQALLFPVMVECSSAEAHIAEQHTEDLKKVGLEVARRGDTTISVHAVPRLLQRGSPERMLRDLLAELSRGGHAFSDAVDLALAQMACHGSIRAGDPLTAEEAQALLRALDETDFTGHCPHGRAVVSVTSWTELERQVGRR